MQEDGDNANDTLSTMFPENNAASASSYSGSYYSGDSYYTGKSDTGNIQYIVYLYRSFLYLTIGFLQEPINDLLTVNIIVPVQ